jgi:pimeloyl-ACP methyl ester carboxylesterase
MGASYLAENFRVLAPDMVGFGYSERPTNIEYGVQTWADQVVGLMDTLELRTAHVVGNSFGGAIALRVATQHPDRVGKLVLMGSMGVPFPITEGLECVWGYEPSFENMRKVLDVFAYSREIVNDELAEVRYQGSHQNRRATPPHSARMVQTITTQVALFSAERVGDPDATVVLAVVEIF